MRPQDVAYIVLATSTPDHPQPATASIVQHLIGAVNAAAFDINAVCSGFVYATTVAERLLRAAQDGRYALVIGADIYSRILDYSDCKTAILFGDGAGAVLLGAVPEARGITETSLLSRGDQYRLISVPAGGSRMPAERPHTAGGGPLLPHGRPRGALVRAGQPAVGAARTAGAGRCGA